MSEVSEAIQAKCLAFGDRIIKLKAASKREQSHARMNFAEREQSRPKVNDYLLEQAASRMSDVRGKKYDVSKGKSDFSPQTSDIRLRGTQPSSLIPQTSNCTVPCH